MICVSKADMKMIVVKVVKMMAMVVMAMDVCLLSLKTINPFAMLLCTSQPAHQPASHRRLLEWTTTMNQLLFIMVGTTRFANWVIMWLKALIFKCCKIVVWLDLAAPNCHFKRKNTFFVVVFHMQEP
jgi:hypothetical protein